MAKKHFALAYPHINVSDDGRTEHVTLYEAVCHHSGPQPNATTKEDDVTCKRCRAYLGFDGHHPSAERYRMLAQEDYCHDDITIDAGARISQAEHGAWVAAWVWVYDPHHDDETADETEYVDEDGMAVNLDDYRDEPEQPFDHQSGPNGCLASCPACGWEAMQAHTGDAV